MVRKRNGMVPIGEAFSGLDGAVKAIRETSPQALHHFTQANQVDQLISAREADPDLGFMARLLALCCLPRTNPGNRTQYVRRNGPVTLVMNAGGIDYKLPYGNIPRLLLAYICTEAVRTQSRVLVLGDSVSEFMRKLDIYSSSGEKYTRLRNQMRRLFNVHVQLIYEDEHGEASVNSLVADRTELWWNPKRPNERSLWESKIELGEKFFNEIIRHPVPLDMNTLKAMKRSSLGLRCIHVADLPYLYPQTPDTALLEATLPPVRIGPGQCERQICRPGLPYRLPARVEEDQAGLVVSELRDGQGRADSASLGHRHPTSRAASASKLGSQIPRSRLDPAPPPASRVPEPLKSAPGASCATAVVMFIHKSM